jgi:hypothetical protein
MEQFREYKVVTFEGVKYVWAYSQEEANIKVMLLGKGYV